MDTPVIPDNSGADDVTPAASPSDERRPEPTQRPHRHFAFDPASSPMVMAALAWNGAVAR